MKSQLHSISGFTSGLEVRVLPGSPLAHAKTYLISRRYFFLLIVEKHLGCNQRSRQAVNDRLGIEPVA